jgi:hypothetical protein
MLTEYTIMPDRGQVHSEDDDEVEAVGECDIIQL